MDPLLPKKRTSSPQSCLAIAVSGFLLFITVIGIIYFSCFGSITHNEHGHTLSNHAFIEEEFFNDSIKSYYSPNGEDDLVESMINLDYDSCSDSPTNCGFKQYSGYLKATNDHEIHYWFFEADTDDDPMTKPIFVWTNGGPGCSGADGLFTEQGPWRVLGNESDTSGRYGSSTRTGSVIYNPDTWIREVNMIFLEQPYGVGFSLVDPGDQPVAGDANAAEDMDAVIRDFLVKFPRYQGHPVYTSAESWGGHYVPMTAWQILVNNEDGHEPYINYKGFLLGNPYTDYYENFYGSMDSLYGHGLMRESDYILYRELCWDNATAVNYSITCDVLYTTAYKSAKELNTYALDWVDCINWESWTATDTLRRIRPQMDAPMHFKALRSMKNILQHHDYDSLGMDITKEKLTDFYWSLKTASSSDSQSLSKRKIGGALSADYSFDTDGYIPCSEGYMKYYLRLPEVQRQYHVKTHDWSACSGKVSGLWPDSDYYRFMQTYYTDIFQDFSMKYNITMAIYSGDDDSICATVGTQYWLDRWDGFVEDEEVDWIPWKDEGNELGGFYTIYHNEEYLDYNALHFFTVRSAGHMVPWTQPGRSLLVLKKFLYEIEDWGVEYGVNGL